MADTKTKRLVFAILSFLDDQKVNGELNDEQLESVEVAIQCLEMAYGLSTSDQNQAAQYAVHRNLLDIFTSQISETAATRISGLTLQETSPEDKQEAEILKNKGNEFMKAEKFSDALESYTQAIQKDGNNAVYYCNRAAACSKLDKHQQAIDDCKQALVIDPTYSKAYGRMGIAYTALNDHESSRECYLKALDLDPGNQSYRNNLELAEQKLREAATGAGFAAGSGGHLGAGAGGGFNVGALLNNPHLMNMASNMMANPQMQQMFSGLMSQQGGGFPDLLQASQQIASQIQQQNPELVEQLRTQMNRPPNNPPQGDQPPGEQE